MRADSERTLAGSNATARCQIMTRIGRNLCRNSSHHFYLQISTYKLPNRGKLLRQRRQRQRRWMNVGRVCDVLLPQAVACQPSLLPQGTDQRRVCYCRCRRRRACAAATAAVRRTAPVDQSEIVARGGLPLVQHNRHRSRLGGWLRADTRQHGRGSRRGTCVSAAAKTSLAGERPTGGGCAAVGWARPLTRV